LDSNEVKEMKKILFGMVLLALAVYVAAEGVITTGTGDLTLAPGSGKLVVNGVTGIGTSSPYYRLTVKEPTTQWALMADFLNGNNEGLFIGHSGSEEEQLYNLPANTVALAADYHSGAGNPAYRSLSLVTSNNPRVTIDTKGNVGMGTSSPWGKFHVVGEYIYFSDPDNYAISFAPGVDNNVNRIYSNYGAGASDKKLVLGSYAGKEDQLVLDTNGNVGVGTTDPKAKLHVSYGSSGQTPNNVDGLYVESGGSMNEYYVFQTASGGGGKSFSITNAGNVGVGTSNPQGKLHVALQSNNQNSVVQFGEGTASRTRRLTVLDSTAVYSPGIRIENSNTNRYNTGTVIEMSAPNVETGALDGVIYFSQNAFGRGVPGGFIGTNSNHPFALKTNGASRIYISSGGNVGVGTTTPNTILDLKGSRPDIHLDKTDDQKSTWLTFQEKGIQRAGVGIHGSKSGYWSENYLVLYSDGRNTGDKAGMKFDIATEAGGWKTAITINNKREVKINDLTGDGDAYLCVHADGTIFRKNTPCR